MVPKSCNSNWLAWVKKKLGKPSAADRSQRLASVRAMIGMGQGKWRDEDPDEYVRRLREGWD